MKDIAFSVSADTFVKEGYKLRFRLDNLSEKPLMFHKDLLYRRSIILLVARDSSFGGVLEEITAIDDTPTGEIKVAVDGSYSNTINLDEIFPSLVAELEKDNLALFWSAVVETIDEDRISHRFNGYCLIEKSL